MRGARRVKPAREDQRLPITPLIPSSIYDGLNQKSESYGSKLLWAACCQGVLPFLHSSEFTLKQGEPYDPSGHPSIKDVAVDNAGNPTISRIHIKGSKTIQWRQGTRLIVG